MLPSGTAKRLALAAGGAALLGLGALGGLAIADNERPVVQPVTRDALAQSNHPRGAKGRTLGLSRVKIRPGAKIPLHHHAGTQASYIQRGTLTYWVKTGGVKVMRGPSDAAPRLVRRIKAGQHGRIRAGQWIVEQPNTHHHAANRGKRPVVILLATLFRRGAPPSIPDRR